MNSRVARWTAAVILISVCTLGARAAERPYQPGGMWMPAQIAEVHGETLKQMGLQLDPKAFANPLEFPLNAMVSLGGCSASFVSPDGLAVTNHHCVNGMLQYNSREGRNLLHEGYIARTRAEELPGGPTARIYVTTAVTDVTERLLGGLKELGDDLARYNALDKRKKEIVKEAEAATPNVRCEVVDFYGGARYYLITRLEIRDVRLVWAPHERVGFYGGDIDNWMWPRHCGDFALLRAYVGRDGKPADYSKDNVPYHAKSYLRLASEGIKAGDLAMVIGYPGRTARLATAAEMRETVEWEYPRMVEMSQKQIDRLHQIADGDPELTIKTASAIFGLENSKKKRQGILAAARESGLLEKKSADERKLRDWIDASPERAARYGGVLERIDALLQERRQTREKDAAFRNIMANSTLLSAAVTIARMVEEKARPDLEREPGYQERDWQRLEQAQARAQKNYARVIEQGVLELYLGEAAKLPAAQRPEIFEMILGKGEASEAAIKARVAELLSQTRLESLETRLELLRKADAASLKAAKDPLLQLALKALPVVKANEERDKRLAGAAIFLRPLYFEALSALNQGRIAPDANGTIRVTFGTVRGFSPAPGKPVYVPFTDAYEVVEKWARNKGATPYDAPPKVLEAIAEKRFGPYADPKLGSVPVDFLTDCDITGGNSGSPTLNARGEFTGIAFDGNIEGVGSDLIFQPEVTRAIHADVRYFKWLLDAVDGGGRLLREMGVEPAFSEKK